MDNTAIEERFRELGFTENELKVYLSLAEAGKASAGILARRAKIPRTTVYAVLASLVRRGLIASHEQEATTLYSANAPGALMRIVEQEKLEVRRKEQRVQELVDMVKPFFRRKQFSVPRIRFFEGEANINSMLYDNVDAWRESAKSFDSTWWGYQDHTFVEKYLPWLEHVWGTWTESEKVCLLSQDAPVEQRVAGRRPGRVIRPISRTFQFTSSVWVVGDYIVLIMSRSEPQYAFMLHDTVFSGNLRAVFQLLWMLTGKSV